MQHDFIRQLDIALYQFGFRLLFLSTLGSSIGTGGSTAEEHRLDGSLVRLINAAPTAYNASIDFHDIRIRELP